MKLLLKPLFEAELPPGFEDIIREKLKGREVRTGETIEVELLGKSLPFKVLFADPSPMIVHGNTRIEISTSELSIFELEFDKPIEDVLPFDEGFVVVLDGEVLILNREGQKIYSEEFEELNGVRVSKNGVVIIHGKSRLKFIKP